MLLRCVILRRRRRLEIQAAGFPECGELLLERASAFQRPTASARLADEREVLELECGEVPRGGPADRYVVADDVPDDVSGDGGIHVCDDGDAAFPCECGQLRIVAAGDNARAAPLCEVGVGWFADAPHLDVDDPRRAQLDELENAIQKLPVR